MSDGDHIGTSSSQWEVSERRLVNCRQRLPAMYHLPK